MPERATIIDILYAEIMGATEAMNDTKTGSPRVHEAARAALQKAVERYTDFCMHGRIPDDLQQIDQRYYN